MVERFRQHLERSGLIPSGSRVLVGYSGGADSTCLLVLLHECGYDLVAAHLHHGQREEADKELELCQAFCDELDIPFVSGNADVPRMARDLGIGLEEAGREARYGFFRQAAFRTGCNLVATAHTRSDNVETVLLNLTRGAGLAGIAGIPERRQEIVRPLLIFSREETRGFCKQRGYWFHDDPANSDVSFSRARVRHRVLPELRSINPAVDEAISRLASLASEEDRFLNGMAAAALEQSEVPLNGELRFLTVDAEAAFERAKLTTLPPVLFKRAARLMVGALGGSTSADQIEALAAGIAHEEKGSVTCDGGLVAVEWDAERVHARQLSPTELFRYALTLPGETISDEFGWQFTAFEEPYSGHKPTRASLSTQMDARKLKGQLYFRTVQAGDSMRPLGFDGTRRLSDLLSEARLSKAARSRLPIVCDLVGPLWAPGVCLDQRVAPGGETERVWNLSFGPKREDARA